MVGWCYLPSDLPHGSAWHKSWERGASQCNQQQGDITQCGLMEGKKVRGTLRSRRWTRCTLPSPQNLQKIWTVRKAMRPKRRKTPNHIHTESHPYFGSKPIRYSMLALPFAWAPPPQHQRCPLAKLEPSHSLAGLQPDLRSARLWYHRIGSGHHFHEQGQPIKSELNTRREGIQSTLKPWIMDRMNGFEGTSKWLLWLVSMHATVESLKTTPQKCRDAPSDDHMVHGGMQGFI